MDPKLLIFIIVVTLMFLGVSVGGFFVFSNFLNREKERARRFRERRAGDKPKRQDP